MKILGRNLSFRNPIHLAAKTPTKKQPLYDLNGNVRTELVVNIERNYKFRTQADFVQWRAAVQRAEDPFNPVRRYLYDLYDEAMLDLHLTGLVEHNIIDSILANTFHIVDANGEVDEELTKVFKSQWFDDYVRYTVESKFWGHSLIQVVKVKDRLTATLIPRRHVSPERGLILVRPEDTSGFDYVNDPSISRVVVEVGKPEELGLLLKVSPMTIIKKFGVLSWAEFAELFGMPLRIAEIQSKDQKDIDSADSMLEQLGRAGRAVFTPGQNVKYEESKRTDAFNVYDKLAERCNTEMSKGIVGGTLANDAGDRGAYALGEVHQQMMVIVQEAYKRMVTYSVNDSLLTVLSNLGYNVEGKTGAYQEVKDLDALFKRLSELLMHYDVEPEWIEKTFGIPVRKKADKAIDPANPDLPAPPKK